MIDLEKRFSATGNGKCNYTNRAIDLHNYYGADRAFLEQVFAAFSEQDTEDFFRGLGIEPYEQEGLLYPRSKQAKSVQEALLQEIQRLSVTLVMEKQVKRIEMTDPGFLVTTADKETLRQEASFLPVAARHLLSVAAGGTVIIWRPVWGMRSQSRYRHLCNCMRRILW